MRFLVSMLCVLLPLCAQQPPEGAKKGPPRAPKNLKVLKVPPTDLRATMAAYSAALGVRCNHCHVQGDFASDENPKKETARKMITMTHAINGHFPDAKEHVSCFTCHRGETTPKMSAPAAQ